MNPLNQPDLRLRCTRWLSGYRPLTQRQWLQDLATAAPDEPLDEFGIGPAVQAFEVEVAALLGKEAAVFLPKGVVAQQIALRTWTDRARCPIVALHPKSHIDLDESGAYERLHGLQPLRLGSDDQPFLSAELAAVRGPLGAVTIELPLRRAGFKLLPWDELAAISGWCRERGVALHMDGARLWECQTYYGRSLADIAGRADSVYVSFYKGLGGLAGCVLAGTREFIDATAVWRVRHGAQLYSIAPYLIAAREGLHRCLPQMPAFVARARELAQVLDGSAGMRVSPSPPHTNAFRLFLPAPKEALERAALQIAEQDHDWLFPQLWETPAPGVTLGEVHVGEATLAWKTDEIVAALCKLVGLAQA